MSLDIELYKEVEGERDILFSANYTHNCTGMADAAGLYTYVWHPEDCPDVKRAGDLIEPLKRGIKEMIDDPDKFIALNPPNGWGSYESFLPWLIELLNACRLYPDAQIYTST